MKYEDARVRMKVEWKPNSYTVLIGTVLRLYPLSRDVFIAWDNGNNGVYGVTLEDMEPIQAEFVRTDSMNYEDLHVGMRVGWKHDSSLIGKVDSVGAKDCTVSWDTGDHIWYTDDPTHLYCLRSK